MKVVIQGQVIDTKKIWRIGPIDSVPNGSWHLQFSIYFLCENTYTVMIPVNVDDKSIGFQVLHQQARERLEKAREELIERWNKSKSKIPEITL